MEEKMHKLLHVAAIAALALALPLAALAQTNLNLDTGATGTSGGDIIFNPGVNIAPVGTAQLADLTTAFGAEFAELSSTSEFETILAEETNYSTTPIGNSSLVANEVIAVHTNGGNYAGVLVTESSSTSITFQYVTYNTSGTKIQGATVTLGGPAGPVVAAVTNNFSFINMAAPNYGIAPGEVITVWGSNLSAPTAVWDSTPANLPFTLNGSSVSVTVGGKTVTPAYEFASAGQLDVVLPSTTPVGTGTITVTYNNVPSNALPITVVPAAYSFDFWGGALAVATDNEANSNRPNHLITASQSTYPGEVITFWGSGSGPDTKNTDVTTNTDYTQTTGITALYFGNVLVPIMYQGRSGQYQGVDQVNVTVPSNAPLGCGVSVVAVSGSGANALVSNIVTLPIASAEGQCTDPLAVVDPGLTTTLSGQGTVKFGYIAISQETSASGTTDNAIAVFDSISGSSLTGYQSSSRPSYGSCYVLQSNSSTVTSPYTLTGLDAGSITVKGPNASQALTTIPEVAGAYFAELPSGFVPSSGGTFTFTGTGGTGVGSFSAPVVFDSPLVWTNSSSDGTVTRGSGVTVNWSGGAAGTYVEITGSSVSSTGTFSASFVCDAPVSALTFTVPPPVLLSLPAGSGSLAVGNYTIPTSFTTASPKLDFAYGMAFASTSIEATYH